MKILIQVLKALAQRIINTSEETQLLRSQNLDLRNQLSNTLRILQEAVILNQSMATELFRPRHPEQWPNQTPVETPTSDLDYNYMTHDEIVNHLSRFYSGTELVTKIQEVYTRRVESQSEEFQKQQELFSALESELGIHSDPQAPPVSTPGPITLTASS